MSEIQWRRVNGEPFEYAIQQGQFGDEFVKLLDGSCLRRPCCAVTDEKAMDIGMMIAEDHGRLLQAMAVEFHPNIPINSLIHLLHGNKVWLGRQIMRAIQEAAAPPAEAKTEVAL